jgi:8-oxo-dGTP diphosphatase
MVLKEKPLNFIPAFQAVGCYCENGDTILLLHRQDHKPQGNTWNIPGGKIDKGETPLEAIIREVQEESGIMLKPSEVQPLNSYYIRYSDCDYLYHTFKAKVDNKAEVLIQPKEAKAFKWVTVKEALKLNLIEDEDYCMIDAYKNI